MIAHSEILSVTLTALPAIAELEPLWLALESRADASFFQSWLWIGTWLECLPTYVAATLLRVERAGSVLGLGILVPRSLSRHKVLHSRGLFLNCTGDPHFDEITIEYNGLLCARGEDSAATKAAIEYLLLENPEWDELYLEGLHRPDIVDSLPLHSARLRRRRQRNFHYVDIADLRTQGGDYLGTLGPKTRHNIRRSVREYEKCGPLRLHEAESIVQARSYLLRLRHFHQRYWEQKGIPGSFSNSYFTTFHDRLIERAFGEKAIQLLRTTTGEKEIGYLYNFVYRGRVYNYQSGFNYDVNTTQNRPGLVCHAYAVQFNLASGMSIYDFMAGDVEYKEALSRESLPMTWDVIQRDRWQFRLEDILRKLHRRMRARTDGTAIRSPAKERKAC